MKICIYGASNEEINDIYKKEAYKLGKAIGEKGHTLDFGGGGFGIMGHVAKGVKDGKGIVIGIAPKYVQNKESKFPKCDEFYTPDTLQERKEMFEKISDAFIILPGGVGTLDEFFETIAQKKLGKINKKVCLYNINGFYNKVLEIIDLCNKEKFLKTDKNELFKTFTNSNDIINYLEI